MSGEASGAEHRRNGVIRHLGFNCSQRKENGGYRSVMSRNA
jgi:hypothetical protein